MNQSVEMAIGEPETLTEEENVKQLTMKFIQICMDLGKNLPSDSPFSHNEHLLRPQHYLQLCKTHESSHFLVNLTCMQFKKIANLND